MSGNFSGGSFSGSVGGFSVDLTPSGGGIPGGGSSDGPKPWKVPQWAIEQREERERAAEEAKRQAAIESAIAARVPVPDVRGLPSAPEVIVSEDTLAAAGRLERVGELGRRIEDIYGIPPAITESNDDEEAALILLLNE